MKFEHKFKVQSNGQLFKEARRFIAQYISEFAGQQIVISITKPKRSSAFNRYYWGIVIGHIRLAMLEASGKAPSPKALHDHFKHRFLPVTVHDMPDGSHATEVTTTKLTAEEMHNYIEQIRSAQDVVQLGVWIESPTQYEDRTGETIKGGTI